MAFTGRSRIRATGAVAVLVLAASLQAVAHHTTCNGQSNEMDATNPCPVFTPELAVKVTSFNNRGGVLPTPVIGAPSQVSFEFGSADHEAPHESATYLLPKGWNLSFGQLQSESPGRASDGSPATECSQVYDTSQPRRAVRAEMLSSSPIMKIRYSSGNSRSSATYQRAGSATSNLAFLRWDEGSGIADLCLQYVTSAGVGDASSRDLVMPVRVTRLSDAVHGWRVDVDLSPFFRNTGLRNAGASIVMNSFHLNGVSAGNHHRNPVTGNLERVIVSRSPFSGVNASFGMTVRGCRAGVDPSNAISICRDARTISVSDGFIIPITPPPKGEPHGFAPLTGPLGLGGGLGTGVSTTAQYQGFGLINGSNVATVTWRQPALPVDSAIRGYVLVLARPNVQDSRVFRRLITDPAEPGFDPTACGPAGNSVNCSHTFTFPLTGIGGATLYGDRAEHFDQGIYDVTLITIFGRIYQEGSFLAAGRRSDGLCDDGTAQGGLCDPTVSPPVLKVPGASYWRFAMRSKRWPQIFIQRGYATTPDGFRKSCSCAPHMTLFLDWESKQAEFTVWEQQTDGMKIGESTGPVPPGSYWAASNGINGNPQQGGTTIFGGINQPIAYYGYVQGSGARARVAFSLDVDARRIRGRILEFQGSRV